MNTLAHICDACRESGYPVYLSLYHGSREGGERYARKFRCVRCRGPLRVGAVEVREASAATEEKPKRARRKKAEVAAAGV